MDHFIQFPFDRAIVALFMMDWRHHLFTPFLLHCLEFGQPRISEQAYFGVNVLREITTFQLTNLFLKHTY